MGTKSSKPSQPPDAPLPKCRYLLDSSTSSTLTLPSGRVLSWAEYGSPDGLPILYNHGLPGCRIEASSYHELAVSLGARIIAIDRPGIGLSTPCAGQTVLSWSEDVAHLVAHLGLESYAVMGVSGGGPYALACAAGLPASQLKCVAVVCGLGPPDMSMWAADWAHWLGFPYGWRYAPAFMLEWFFRLDAFGRMDLSDEERERRVLDPAQLAKVKNEKDRRIMSDVDFVRLGLRSMREANRQGFGGIAMDGKVACSDWGFRIEDIRRDLPVLLWYGDEDRFIPPDHGRGIAERLGGKEGKAVLRIKEGDTHYSISQDWKREQLEKILEEMRR